MMDQIAKRVYLGDGGVLRWTKVMAGEYRCDTEHGTYYVWATTKLVHRRTWFRAEECWRLDHGRDMIGNYRTFTDAKVAANHHHRESSHE